ncbi:organic hydroperoxide resistance protein [Bremerella alba]|uniref:Organic hydroperoxide resistance protein OhrB n=1 Tax=Bremerella alba TaxID=980252 RepID=A0A7V8VAD4_9BACT|nr:organic hydroperoxide resistance protein [Bremerella alba]MBA2117856.1 Organic hydroperoxide resistance protein OhrB [Bremerella alba]
MSQLERNLYTAKAHTTGGRDGGVSRTSDHRLEVKLTNPGAKGDGTNPEQLFAMGWSSCFLSAIKLAEAAKKLRLSPDTAVDAEVDLNTKDGKYYLAARLYVTLPDMEARSAQDLIDEAHRLRPYSRAVHGNIEVETKLAETVA